MKRFLASGLLTAALMAGTGACASAQDMDFLPVGAEAPDVELNATTRYGALSERLSLSDFRGETVVLAFFYRVRTPG